MTKTICLAVCVVVPSLVQLGCAKCSNAAEASSEAAAIAQNCARPPADAEQLAPDLWQKTLREGKIDYLPRELDIVTADITLWSARGEVLFTARRDLPPLAANSNDGPIGLAVKIASTMKKGETRRLWGSLETMGTAVQEMPANWPKGPICAELTVVDINKSLSEAPRAALPDDLRKPPPTVEFAEGVQFVRLQKGNGTRHPTAQDTVEMLVSAWYLGGPQAHHSVFLDDVVSRPVHELPRGAMLLMSQMVEGDAVRAWIPAGLGIPASKGPRDVPMAAELKLLRIFQTARGQ